MIPFTTLVAFPTAVLSWQVLSQEIHLKQRHPLPEKAPGPTLQLQTKPYKRRNKTHKNPTVHILMSTISNSSVQAWAKPVFLGSQRWICKRGLLVAICNSTIICKVPRIFAYNQIFDLCLQTFADNGINHYFPSSLHNFFFFFDNVSVSSQSAQFYL